MGKKKLMISFSEDSRRDYLLGFRKRKNERRKVARDKIEKKLMEERKAVRDARRKANGPSRVYAQNVEDLLSTLKEETIDLPTHSVTITQMEDLDLAQEDLFLGRNHFFEQAEEISPEDEESNPSCTKKSGLSHDAISEIKAADPKKVKSLERMMAKLKGKRHHAGGRGAVHGRPGRGVPAGKPMKTGRKN